MIRFTGLAVICNLRKNRSAVNIHLRTFVNLVILPLSLFSDNDISTFWELNALRYVPVYMVFRSGIAPISLVENDVFSHLKKRTCIYSNIYKSGISV